MIITHSVSTHTLYGFIHDELKLNPSQNATLFGDAERKVYAAYGLGELSLLNVINKDILEQVMDMKKNEGIANRLTRGTRCVRHCLYSVLADKLIPRDAVRRWQTNGAYAIGTDGKIAYKHVGKDSSDMADLDAAIKSVV